MANGIDISMWQGTNIDFNKVKASGIDYVIIRGGYGRYASQKDPTFEANYKKAKAAGLDVGVYWYSYAVTPAEAVQEASTCIAAIKGKSFEYPIYYDLEEQSQFLTGKSNCSNIVTAFCNELEAHGYFAGLYISRSPLQSYITTEVASRYALWVAEYGTRLNYSGSVGMWQFTDRGSVNGINGNVDRDTAYVDYPSIIKTKGYNGYKANTKVLDATGLKSGDQSPAVYNYKCLLRIAKQLGLVTANTDDHDLFGSGTVKGTNQLLKRYGYDETGIAGTELIRKLTYDILAVISNG